MKELEPKTVESSELVKETFKFWFSDHEHIRSPFPGYIQSQLKEQATDLFFDWTSNLDPKAKDEVNETVISEKFEEIIFETALKLVLTEDEKITILYPFLPRLEDQLVDADDQDCKVVDRDMFKEGDHSFMRVKLENLATKELTETKFELPA